MGFVPVFFPGEDARGPTSLCCYLVELAFTIYSCCCGRRIRRTSSIQPRALTFCSFNKERTCKLHTTPTNSNPNSNFNFNQNTANILVKVCGGKKEAIVIPAKEGRKVNSPPYLRFWIFHSAALHFSVVLCVEVCVCVRCVVWRTVMPLQLHAWSADSPTVPCSGSHVSAVFTNRSYRTTRVYVENRVQSISFDCHLRRSAVLARVGIYLYNPSQFRPFDGHQHGGQICRLEGSTHDICRKPIDLRHPELSVKPLLKETNGGSSLVPGGTRDQTESRLFLAPFQSHLSFALKLCKAYALHSKTICCCEIQKKRYQTCNKNQVFFRIPSLSVCRVFYFSTLDEHKDTRNHLAHRCRMHSHCRVTQSSGDQVCMLGPMKGERLSASSSGRSRWLSS